MDNTTIKKPFGIKFLIFYLILLILRHINILRDYFHIVTLLAILITFVLIYGVIRKKYWAIITAISVYIFYIIYSIYDILAIMIRAMGFRFYLVLGDFFINVIEQLFYNFPIVVLIIYLISSKNYFKNLETGKFEKVMSLFLIMGFFVLLYLLYKQFF